MELYFITFLHIKNEDVIHLLLTITDPFSLAHFIVAFLILSKIFSIAKNYVEFKLDFNKICTD